MIAWLQSHLNQRRG
ncbi:unnamed protein product [Tuber melanosporum]|uniref:(Perigord truffle) hypothetical protein n=1 Tax=Tuber melanosporum (strain Mel28) TaxID=656061 RepID=D5GF40_TUBMM|nr:unnamed protein product [Tuber melanosporum]